MREEAEREYEELERSLTPEQRKKLDDVMGRLAALKRVSRQQKRETERRAEEGRSKGLAASALEKIAAEVAEQFESEKKELKRQIEREKKELAKMLKAPKDGG